MLLFTLNYINCPTATSRSTIKTNYFSFPFHAARVMLTLMNSIQSMFCQYRFQSIDRFKIYEYFVSFISKRIQRRMRRFFLGLWFRIDSRSKFWMIKNKEKSFLTMTKCPTIEFIAFAVSIDITMLLPIFLLRLDFAVIRFRLVRDWLNALISMIWLPQ